VNTDASTRSRVLLSDTHEKTKNFFSATGQEHTMKKIATRDLMVLCHPLSGI